jgi:hypothetical protein
VATALNDRPNVLLAGEVYSVPASFERDLRVANLEKPIVVDGRVSDWDQPGGEPHRRVGARDRRRAAFSYRYRIGRHGTGVYALFEVDDEHVVLRDPERPELGASDHVQIAVVTATTSSCASRSTRAATGRSRRGSCSRTAAACRTTASSDLAHDATGFLVELRLPRTLIGPRLSFASWTWTTRRRARSSASSARPEAPRRASSSAPCWCRRPRSASSSAAWAALVADLGGGRQPPRAGARGIAAPAGAAAPAEISTWDRSRTRGSSR